MTRQRQGSRLGLSCGGHPARATTDLDHVDHCQIAGFGGNGVGHPAREPPIPSFAWTSTSTRGLAGTSPAAVRRGRGTGTRTARAAMESMVILSNMTAALSSSGGSVVVGGILKVLDQQRSNELGRLDLRKVSDRRRIVQHEDAGERSLVPSTRKDMGSTNRVRGAPDESLWTRIAFDGTRPPGGMLAAFGHIPKQGGRHPRS